MISFTGLALPKCNTEILISVTLPEGTMSYYNQGSKLPWIEAVRGLSQGVDDSRLSSWFSRAASSMSESAISNGISWFGVDYVRQGNTFDVTNKSGIPASEDISKRLYSLVMRGGGSQAKLEQALTSKALAFHFDPVTSATQNYATCGTWDTTKKAVAGTLREGVNILGENLPDLPKWPTIVVSGIGFAFAIGLFLYLSRD